MTQPVRNGKPPIILGPLPAKRPVPDAPPPRPPVAGVVVKGPNHALHFILTVLTFWACGGWLWVWLIVAFSNKRRIQPVDVYGNIIPPPDAPAEPSFADRMFYWMIRDDGSVNWAQVAFVVATMSTLLIWLVCSAL